MKLNETGKYFELPIGGLKIKEIIFNGLLRLVFDDQENSSLDLHSNFKASQYNQTTDFNPRNQEALVLFFNYFDKPIARAKADKYGNLWLTFENGMEISVADGPYENWHYTKKSSTNSKDILFVHGGVGRTTY
jgi:hypothetical protein